MRKYRKRNELLPRLGIVKDGKMCDNINNTHILKKEERNVDFSFPLKERIGGKYVM